MSKFAIDPGHGDVNGSLGGDGGAAGYLNEQNCALDIANRVITKLQALGHEAWNVRPSSAYSVTDSLQKRCDSADGADYLASIHLNAGGGKGSEIFAMSSAGNTLASKVLSELVALGFVNRGVKDGSGLYVIRHSNPVAILVEVCFVDSQTDTNLYNQLGAEAIANAIVKGLTGQTINNQTPKPNQSIMALQYDFNMVRNAGLQINGIVDQPTLNAVNSYYVKKGENNAIVKWIQQKLIGWGYLAKGKDSGLFEEATFQAVTNLQKNWGRVTDGIIGPKTWEIFLTN